MYVRVLSLETLKDVIREEKVLWVGYKVNAGGRYDSSTSVSVVVRTEKDFFEHINYVRKTRLTQMFEKINWNLRANSKDQESYWITFGSIRTQFKDVVEIPEEMLDVLPSDLYYILCDIIDLKSNENIAEMKIKKDDWRRLYQWIRKWEEQRAISQVLGKLNIPSRINLYSNVVLVRECDCE